LVIGSCLTTLNFIFEDWSKKLHSKRAKLLSLKEVEEEIDSGFKLSKLASINLNDAVGEHLFIMFKTNTLRWVFEIDISKMKFKLFSFSALWLIACFLHHLFCLTWIVIKSQLLLYTLLAFWFWLLCFSTKFCGLARLVSR